MIVGEALKHFSYFIFFGQYLSFDCDEDIKNKLHVWNSMIDDKQKKAKNRIL
jgi:hypothetical protein